MESFLKRNTALQYFTYKTQRNSWHNKNIYETFSCQTTRSSNREAVSSIANRLEQL